MALLLRQSVEGPLDVEAQERTLLLALKWLGLVPAVALFAGMPFLNSAEPQVLGLPLPLAWATGCTLLTAAVLALVYALDPANRTP